MEKNNLKKFDCVVREMAKVVVKEGRYLVRGDLRVGIENAGIKCSHDFLKSLTKYLVTKKGKNNFTFWLKYWMVKK